VLVTFFPSFQVVYHGCCGSPCCRDDAGFVDVGGPCAGLRLIWFDAWDLSSLFALVNRLFTNCLEFRRIGNGQLG
jgi:hypothetical protein